MCFFRRIKLWINASALCIKIFLWNWKLSELALCHILVKSIVFWWKLQFWLLEGECDECTDGKNIPFPDILDNEDVTYKEWRQNNHKRLAKELGACLWLFCLHSPLDIKECQVGELKEKLLEGFNNYQKHVGVKRVMYAILEKDKLDPNCMLL